MPLWSNTTIAALSADEDDALNQLADRLTTVVETSVDALHAGNVTALDAIIARTDTGYVQQALSGGNATLPADNLLPGSVTATGKSPNILSKRARFDLIRDMEWIAVLLLVAAVGITFYVLIVDTNATDASHQIGSVWVAPVIVLALVATVLLIIAYFTVMGFGEVSLHVGVGSDSGDSSSSDSGGTQGTTTTPGGGGDQAPAPAGQGSANGPPPAPPPGSSVR